MRAAKIVSGAVTEVIEVGAVEDWPGYVGVPDSVGVGWAEDGNGGYVAPAPIAPAPCVDACLTAAQNLLDTTAAGLGYDSIAVAVTYADESAVPAYQADGLALRSWRSLVWAAAFAIVDEINGAVRTQPTVADFLSELPAFPGV